jgi:hypothetical protein
MDGLSWIQFAVRNLQPNDPPKSQSAIFKQVSVIRTMHNKGVSACSYTDEQMTSVAENDNADLLSRSKFTQMNPSKFQSGLF